MKRQPHWDQFEVALLVDAYIRITEKGENKKTTLEQLSKQLRDKACNEGLEIDDTFRNLNGMMWQIGFIECAFKKTGYGKHMPSKLFQHVVDLYQENREEYNRILTRAIKKTYGENVQKKIEVINNSMLENREAFLKWLNLSSVGKRNEYICNAFDEASTYAMGHRISKRAIWEVDNSFELKQYFQKLKSDKLYNVIHKESAHIVVKAESLYLRFFEENRVKESCNGKIQNKEEDIIRIVSEKYVYGYRLDSVIERMKLRGYLTEQGINFEGSDEELEDIIVRNGFVSNGKVLIELENKNEKFTREIDDIFCQGVSVIYYENFFELHTSLMEETHISSAELLKTYLKEKRNDLTFSKNFFSSGEKVTEDLAVAQEILRVWGENVLTSADDLSEKLPYIPYEKIKFYLSQSINFIWVSEGVYTRLSSIKITDNEKKIIEDFATSEIERKGYLSLSELPLDDVKEENYELSEYAILFGAYSKCLSEKYCLHGRIITKMDSEFDATVLMQQFCNDQDEITLDDAIAKVEEFTGVADRRIAYPALYETMIRVSEQNFVSQKKICFENEKIDEQIGRFVTDGFCALKEITTFALFPECGYPWNQYILESFCYRFSDKYVYRTNLFNARNAGAVIDKNLMWDYQEIMAQAVARSSIDLNEEAIGVFLLETGYMARSKFGGIKEIAERAKIIREENN